MVGGIKKTVFVKIMKVLKYQQNVEHTGFPTKKNYLQWIKIIKFRLTFFYFDNICRSKI